MYTCQKRQGWWSVTQITKKARKPKTFVPTGGERGEWLGDVIYLREYAGVNKRRTAIFTIMEVNSRYVYARALTKATSAKTAQAMGLRVSWEG